MRDMPFNAGRAVGYLDLDTTGFKKGFKSAMQDIETFKINKNKVYIKIKTTIFHLNILLMN